MVNQQSIVIWSHPVRGNVVFPAPGQDYGIFEAFSVLTKFVPVKTSRSLLFCDCFGKMYCTRDGNQSYDNCFFVFYLVGQVISPKNVYRVHLCLLQLMHQLMKSTKCYQPCPQMRPRPIQYQGWTIFIIKIINSYHYCNISFILLGFSCGEQLNVSGLTCKQGERVNLVLQRFDMQTRRKGQSGIVAV